MKKIFNGKLLHRLVLLFIFIQPLIDMDYLVFEWLDRFGLPRFSTVIRFIILPLLVLWSFWLREKNKKRTSFIALFYGAVFLIYFVLHARQAEGLVERLWLTDNFRFSTFQ